MEEFGNKVKSTLETAEKNIERALPSSSITCENGTYVFASPTGNITLSTEAPLSNASYPLSSTDGSANQTMSETPETLSAVADPLASFFIKSSNGTCFVVPPEDVEELVTMHQNASFSLQAPFAFILTSFIALGSVFLF